MKKFLCLLLSAIAVLSLAACSDSTDYKAYSGKYLLGSLYPSGAFKQDDFLSVEVTLNSDRTFVFSYRLTSECELPSGGMRTASDSGKYRIDSENGTIEFSGKVLSGAHEIKNNRLIVTFSIGEASVKMLLALQVD